MKNFIKTNIQDFLRENTQYNSDKMIYDLISDWVISSLDDTEKRRKIGEELLKLEIPNEYKKVPSNRLYRVGESNNKFTSYSYDYRGIKKMISWYKEIFNRNVTSEEIKEVSVHDVDVLICIPTFLRKTGFSSGRRFDSIWKSEYEVIVLNI